MREHAPAPRAVVVIEKRMRHAERLKDVIGGELGERLLGCPLYDNAEQQVVRVAVNPPVSGDVFSPL